MRIRSIEVVRSENEVKKKFMSHQLQILSKMRKKHKQSRSSSVCNQLGEHLLGATVGVREAMNKYRQYLMGRERERGV